MKDHIKKQKVDLSKKSLDDKCIQMRRAVEKDNNTSANSPTDSATMLES
jgi:hypothetical protein